MGNCCAVEGAVDHWIYIKTGDRRDSLQDAYLRIILYDNLGNRSPDINLTCYFKNDFERGKTEVFQAPPLGSDFGEVVTLELIKENSSRADWYLELIVVNDRRTDNTFYFPFQRWVKCNVPYKVQKYDTMLAQNDPSGEQRRKELQEKREDYRYTQKAPDLPVQVRGFPADERFSDESRWDLLGLKSQLLAGCLVKRLPPQPWETLEDLTNIYAATKSFPEPSGTDRWSNDLCFGSQRLMGCNPNVIQLCTELPENMGVTAEMLRPFLEGWSFKQIIQAKRLFVVDLRILEDLPTKDDRPLCAPLALFFVTGDKDLVPIAIQLYQDIAPDNPVFLPNDPPFTWLLAKMWFNNADAVYHQCLNHLCYTHLLMEGVCIAAHRHLSPSHPIYKLLAPHFLFLPGINAYGIDKLMSSGGWIDKCMTCGREGMFELMRRGIEEWRLDTHGILPKECESRGVFDPKTLPGYAYRDDGMLIYKAIDHYVAKIARHYYDNTGKLKEDIELQNWFAELARPRENGGVGLKGIPNNGKCNRLDDLTLVCCCIIWTCSGQHAAISLCQYDEYGFPPNYPAILRGEPPLDKTPKTEEDVVEILPNKEQTLDIMAVTRLLSTRAKNTLGEWEFQYQYEPAALQAEKEFKEELLVAAAKIKSRNSQRRDIYKYPYLDLELVGNNINV